MIAAEVNNGSAAETSMVDLPRGDALSVMAVGAKAVAQSAARVREFV